MSETHRITVDPALARWLCANGHEAVHVGDLGMLAAIKKHGLKPLTSPANRHPPPGRGH